jgi:hypothetical protein
VLHLHLQCAPAAWPVDGHSSRDDQRRRPPRPSQAPTPTPAMPLLAPVGPTPVTCLSATCGGTFTGEARPTRPNAWQSSCNRSQPVLALRDTCPLAPSPQPSTTPHQAATPCCCPALRTPHSDRCTHVHAPPPREDVTFTLGTMGDARLTGLTKYKWLHRSVRALTWLLYSDVRLTTLRMWESQTERRHLRFVRAHARGGCGGARNSCARGLRGI